MYADLVKSCLNYLENLHIEIEKLSKLLSRRSLLKLTLQEVGIPVGELADLILLEKNLLESSLNLTYFHKKFLSMVTNSILIAEF
jgi:hypothetical protein